MKTLKIIALICAMGVLAVGVDYVGWAVAWLLFIFASWFVLSDKELMAKWNDFMDQIG